MNKSALWKLAVGDIVFKFNGDLVSTLGSVDEPKEVLEQILDAWWNIKDTKSLLKTLEWLEHEGHSSIYKRALAGEANGFQKRFIKKFGDTLAGVDLLAWDLGRYSSIVRWGHHAGLINEDQAWVLLNRTSLRLQKAYSSWEVFAEHYLLGRFFWDGNVDHQQQMHNTLDFLLKNKYSPWKIVPWGTPLNNDDHDWREDNPFFVDLGSDYRSALIAKQKYFRRMIRNDNENPFVYNAYAQFLENKLMDPESALTYYLKSLKVNDKFLPGYRNAISLICENSDRREQTKEIFDLWINRMPECQEAFFKYADWSIYKYGDADMGQFCYERSIELNPNEYAFYVDYGYFLAYVKYDFESARKMYLKALDINPTGEEALANLSALRQGIDAIKEFTESDKYSKFFGDAYPSDL